MPAIGAIPVTSWPLHALRPMQTCSSAGCDGGMGVPASVVSGAASPLLEPSMARYSWRYPSQSRTPERLQRRKPGAVARAAAAARLGLPSLALALRRWVLNVVLL